MDTARATSAGGQASHGHSVLDTCPWGGTVASPTPASLPRDFPEQAQAWVSVTWTPPAGPMPTPVGGCGAVRGTPDGRHGPPTGWTRTTHLPHCWALMPTMPPVLKVIPAPAPHLLSPSHAAGDLSWPAAGEWQAGLELQEVASGRCPAAGAPNGACAAARGAVPLSSRHTVPTVRWPPPLPPAAP